MMRLRVFCDCVVQFLIIGAILLNVATGNYIVHTTIGELAPAMLEYNSFIAGKSIIWCISVWVVMTGIFQASINVKNVYQKLGFDEFLREGVPGLVPLWQWLLCVIQVFINTDWAWQNPALAVTLLTPSFCLINSQLIVNNVTDMETVIDSKSFMIWYFLLPLNRQNQWLPEEVVVAIVFGITTVYYAVWVYCTISQICRYLDIYCLSIKEKKAPTSSAA